MRQSQAWPPQPPTSSFPLVGLVPMDHDHPLKDFRLSADTRIRSPGKSGSGSFTGMTPVWLTSTSLMVARRELLDQGVPSAPAAMSTAGTICAPPCPPSKEAPLPATSQLGSAGGSGCFFIRTRKLFAASFHVPLSPIFPLGPTKSRRFRTPNLKTTCSPV